MSLIAAAAADADAAAVPKTPNLTILGSRAEIAFASYGAVKFHGSASVALHANLYDSRRQTRNIPDAKKRTA